jgi:hypothetical protein
MYIQPQEKIPLFFALRFFVFPFRFTFFFIREKENPWRIPFVLPREYKKIQNKRDKANCLFVIVASTRPPGSARPSFRFRPFL